MMVFEGLSAIEVFDNSVIVRDFCTILEKYRGADKDLSPDFPYNSGIVYEFLYNPGIFGMILELYYESIVIICYICVSR